MRRLAQFSSSYQGPYYGPNHLFDYHLTIDHIISLTMGHTIDLIMGLTIGLTIAFTMGLTIGLTIP